MNMTLPTDSEERKEIPLYRGLFAYFPAALARIARHSKESNDKHNPGEPMHHARGKSTDHEDCILRHTMDLGDLLAAYERDHSLEVPTVVDAILYEATARAWRSLAALQELCERFAGAPLAPNARLPAPEPERLYFSDWREVDKHIVDVAEDVLTPKCITEDCERRALFGAVRCQECLDDYIVSLRRDSWTPGCDRVVGRCRCGGVH